MPELKQYVLFEFTVSDRSLPKQVGLKPRSIRDPSIEPLPVRLRKLRPARITEEDTRWLEECGIAWEQKPAVQLSLNFFDCQESVQET